MGVALARLAFEDLIVLLWAGRQVPRIASGSTPFETGATPIQRHTIPRRVRVPRLCERMLLGRNVSVIEQTGQPWFGKVQ
jgi:hypothetical protein